MQFLIQMHFSGFMGWPQKSGLGAGKLELMLTGAHRQFTPIYINPELQTQINFL